MNLKKYISIGGVLLFASIAIIACKKDYEYLFTENKELSNKASIKVFNGTISSLRTYVYADNVPLTGGVVPYGGVFPSTGFGALLDPGTKTLTLKDTLATSTQPAININTNLEAGKTYTIFTYDTINAIKYVVKTATIEQPADTTARLRFANLIFSKNTLPNVDVYSVKKGGNVFTNVPTGTVTEFMPYASFKNDTLYVRATGTTTNLTSVFTINPTPKRSYTVIYRGRYETTTGTAMNRSLTSMADY